jgi:hypothetical protein
MFSIALFNGVRVNSCNSLQFGSFRDIVVADDGEIT